MSPSISAVLLAVGTELTEGSVLNTHFRFLGAELKGLGVRVLRGTQLPDEPQLFRQELRRALAQADLVILTGGLGPTSDDLTREIVAEVAGVGLGFQEGIWRDLVARYSSAGRRISATNRKQALIPDGFTVLANPVGTAPGFCGKVGAALLAALPGPPAELEEMVRSRLLPLLSRTFFPDRGPAGEGELVGTALLIPESLLEEILLELRAALSPASWSTRVVEDHIVFTLRAPLADERERMFAGLLRRFGPLRIRRGEVRLNVVLLDLLRSQGKRICLAESCTGGLIAKRLSDVPGSSQALWGAVVAYSNQAKGSWLGVPESTIRTHGAVSAEVASAMSQGLLARCDGELALAVTGIAGPDGGSAEKPVGTVWISARSRGGREICRCFHFSGNRDAVRRRSCVAAMLLAESLLLEREPALDE